MIGEKMIQDVLEKMTPIFREALDTPDLILNEELDATKVENWDSLNHISLIIALEEAFFIQFETEELVALVNVGDMAKLIANKMNNR